MDDATRGFDLVFPEFGPIDAILGYVLFYFLVGLTTGIVTEALQTAAPYLVPEPLSTWAAMLLWVMLGLILLSQVMMQVQNNPRRFDTVEALDEFLAQHRPSERRYLWWASWVVLGGTIAYLLFPSFIGSFGMAIRFSLDFLFDPFPYQPFRVVDAVNFVGFFLGYSLMTRGLDRLIIGSLRSLIADFVQSTE